MSANVTDAPAPALGAGLRLDAPARTWGNRLALVLLALLLFRLVALALNATDLFFDEAQYWSWSLNPDFGYYSKPPMIAWLIGLATGACGVTEFCVRLPSPILHTLTGLAVGLVGWRLYGAQTGFWAGCVFATLPGVSLSAGIISTDVPLLLWWAVALYAFIELIDSEDWWPALLLGLALGAGLNAKYAMAYFVLCALIFMIATPGRRGLLADLRWWSAVALGLLLIAPNLYWNYENSFATFSHTADNAKWGGPLFHPEKALEFFGAQFGVFGPILFAGLLTIVVRACRQGVPREDRMLLAFALPVIAIVTVQAFLSRAHANWAAVSYVAAAVLVTATMIRDLSWGWLRASLVIHGVVVVLLALGTTLAGSIAAPDGRDPFARTLGWREVGAAVRDELAKARKSGKPFGSVVTTDRSLTAELLYYMRGARVPVYAWRRKGQKPKDHYQLTRPFGRQSKEPVLLVGLRRDAGIPAHFEKVTPLGVRMLPAGAGAPRKITFWRLEGFKGL